MFGGDQVNVCGTALDAVRDGNLWFNHNLEEGFLSYAAGARVDGSPRVLVMLYDVSSDQASAYYMDLFRVVTGLMESFLMKTWEYDESRSAGSYIDGTGVLNSRRFSERLSLAREMRTSHTTSYRLIRIATGDRPA
jgi:hypothetical protein